MLAGKNAGEKRIVRTKERITGNIVVEHNTVKFTQYLETYPTVQNLGGNFQRGIFAYNGLFYNLTVLGKLEQY